MGVLNQAFRKSLSKNDVFGKSLSKTNFWKSIEKKPAFMPIKEWLLEGAAI